MATSILLCEWLTLITCKGLSTTQVKFDHLTNVRINDHGSIVCVASFPCPASVKCIVFACEDRNLYVAHLQMEENVVRITINYSIVLGFVPGDFMFSQCKDILDQALAYPELCVLGRERSAKM